MSKKLKLFAFLLSFSQILQSGTLTQAKRINPSTNGRTVIERKTNKSKVPGILIGAGVAVPVLGAIPLIYFAVKHFKNEGLKEKIKEKHKNLSDEDINTILSFNGISVSNTTDEQKKKATKNIENLQLKDSYLKLFDENLEQLKAKNQIKDFLPLLTDLISRKNLSMLNFETLTDLVIYHNEQAVKKNTQAIEILPSENPEDLATFLEKNKQTLQIQESQKTSNSNTNDENSKPQPEPPPKKNPDPVIPLDIKGNPKKKPEKKDPDDESGTKPIKDPNSDIKDKPKKDPEEKSSEDLDLDPEKKYLEFSFDIDDLVQYEKKDLIKGSGLFLFDVLISITSGIIEYDFLKEKKFKFYYNEKNTGNDEEIKENLKENLRLTCLSILRSMGSKNDKIKNMLEKAITELKFTGIKLNFTNYETDEEYLLKCIYSPEILKIGNILDLGARTLQSEKFYREQKIKHDEMMDVFKKNGVDLNDSLIRNSIKSSSLEKYSILNNLYKEKIDVNTKYCDKIELKEEILNQFGKINDISSESCVDIISKTKEKVLSTPINNPGIPEEYLGRILYPKHKDERYFGSKNIGNMFTGKYFHNTQQVASQYNGLESVSSDHSLLPFYKNDRTQGPSASLASLSAITTREVAWHKEKLPNSLINVLSELESVEKIHFDKKKGAYVSEKKNEIIYKNGYFTPQNDPEVEEALCELFKSDNNIAINQISQQAVFDFTDNDQVDGVPFTQIFSSGISYQGFSSYKHNDLSELYNFENLYQQYLALFGRVILEAYAHPDKICVLHVTGVGAGAFDNPKNLAALCFLMAYNIFKEKILGKNIIVLWEGGDINISGVVERFEKINSLYDDKEENENTIKEIKAIHEKIKKIEIDPFKLNTEEDIRGWFK